MPWNWVCSRFGGNAFILWYCKYLTKQSKFQVRSFGCVFYISFCLVGMCIGGGARSGCDEFPKWKWAGWISKYEFRQSFFRAASTLHRANCSRKYTFGSRTNDSDLQWESVLKERFFSIFEYFSSLKNELHSCCPCHHNLRHHHSRFRCCLVQNYVT